MFLIKSVKSGGLNGPFCPEFHLSWFLEIKHSHRTYKIRIVESAPEQVSSEFSLSLITLRISIQNAVGSSSNSYS